MRLVVSVLCGRSETRLSVSCTESTAAGTIELQTLQANSQVLTIKDTHSSTTAVVMVRPTCIKFDPKSKSQPEPAKCEQHSPNQHSNTNECQILPK